MDDEEHDFNDINNSKIKSFSLTQSMNQLENLNVNASPNYKHGRRKFADNPKPFKPIRTQGGDQNVKRALIFPSLQRFQKSQSHQQKGDSTQFFSLLKASAPPPSINATSTPQRSTIQAQSPHITDTVPKHELSSDVEFSSPLSAPSLRPLFQIHNDPPRSSQMLPPSRPPNGPISRPCSGANSVISARLDETLVDRGDSPPLSTPQSKGLSDIAINALQEVQTVNAELAEERRQKQSILSQLNALSSTHESLKSAHASLQQEQAISQRQIDSMKLELSSAHDNCTSLNESLTSTKKELVSVQHELSTTQDELNTTKHELGEVKAKTRTIKNKFLLEGGEMKKALGNMEESYAALQSSFRSLKLSYDTSQNLLDEMRSVRQFAAEKLRVVEPLLNENAQYARAAEFKTIISELQDQVADSHRVNDLLRDKLHNLSSQFAQANERVRELEADGKKKLDELIMTLKGCEEKMLKTEMSKKVNELAEQVINREKESINALTEAASLEQKLKASDDCLQDVKKALQEAQKEVKELKDVQESNRSLGVRLEDITTKWKGAQEALKELGGKLDSANEGAIAAEKVILVLREKVKSLEDGLNKSHDACKKAEESLAGESLKGALTRASCQLLEEELAKAKKESGDREELLRQSDTRIAVLQERLDAQTITLRMAKEHCGDLQERLTLSEASFATKLASATSKLEADLTVLKERNDMLQSTFDNLKQEAANQQAAFIGASVEFDQKMAKQEAMNDRLIKSEQKRAEVLELQVTEAKNVAQELRERITQFEQEKKKLVTEGESAEAEQVRVLKEVVEELEAMNKYLTMRSRNLKERYSAGDLSDEEKDFVDSLVNIFQSLHAQEDVTKDNELRRRDNTISTLQARVKELESSLARLLKEKEKEIGMEIESMVDLNSWLSSPRGPDDPVNTSKTNEPTPTPSKTPAPVVPAMPLGTPSDPRTNEPTPIPIPRSRQGVRPKAKPQPKPGIKLSKLAAPNNVPPEAKTFSMLNASNSDSEEDIPLSELSDISTVLGKRDRHPSSAEKEVSAARRLRTTTRPSESSSQLQEAPIVAQKKTTEATAKSKKKRKQ